MQSFLRGVKRFFTNPDEFRKGYAMVTTAAGELLAGLLHGSVKNFVVGALPIATTIYGSEE